LFGGFDLDTEMVERPGAAMPPPLGVLDQDQLQGWLGDGEVGVAGSDLGGFGGEQLGVEVDGGVEVGDVEGQLDTRHEKPPVTSTLVDTLMITDTSTFVNGRVPWAERKLSSR
jgi:hypothetical protein